MKTTLEIPDELIRRIKLHAVRRNQKLKDAVAQLLEAGMAAALPSDAPARPPRPVRLRHRVRLAVRDIDQAIEKGRAS